MDKKSLKKWSKPEMKEYSVDIIQGGDNATDSEQTAPDSYKTGS